MRVAKYYDYTIDENGNVFNKYNHKMKSRYDVNGNYVVSLSVNGKRKTLRVVRLMYMAFHPDIDISDKIVRCDCDDDWASIDDLYLVESSFRDKERVNFYKDTGFRNKQEVIDKYLQYLKHPFKYRKEIKLLEWILKKEN